MRINIKQRVREEADYIINTNQTIREISKYFKVSKSTAHDDLSKRLKFIDLELYNKVIKILNYHAKIKHLKGGTSTKLKYSKG